MKRLTASTRILGALLLTATSAAAQDAFVPSALLPTTGCHDQIAWADLDGDGDLDLVSGPLEGGWVSCFENLGFAKFGPERLVIQAAGALIRILDVGADGDPDVLLGRLDNGEITVLENDGAGGLAPSGTFATGAFGVSNFDLDVSDVDGDGDEDLFFCSPMATLVGWVENRGAAGLGPVVRLDQAADAVASIDTGDLDGDGIVDLVTAHDDPLYLTRWYRGIGGGAFEPAATLFDWEADGGDGDAIDVQDFNGDGLDDVGLEALLSRYSYWPNRGGLLFGPSITMVPPGGLCGSGRAVQIADHDGDGDLDIFQTCYNNFLDWYRNDSGSFVHVQTISDFGSCNFYVDRYCAVADIDGDGDLDFATDGRFLNEIQLWVNAAADCSGNGVLDPMQTAGTGLDQNRNGQLDVCESVGAQYCTDGVFTNSRGQRARIDAIGSDVAASGDLMLVATQAPTHVTGYFLASLLPGSEYTAGLSVGRVCLDGSIGRFAAPGQIQNTGPDGAAILAVDPTQIPTPTSFMAAMPGVTWHFQFWFRDPGASKTSNFTGGTAVTFW